MPQVTAVLATVRGHVQGVGFRVRTVQQAERLGVAGWVRNCPDGTVEAWAEGARPDVRTFLDWLADPGFTSVRGVTEQPQASQGFGTFDIRS